MTTPLATPTTPPAPDRDLAVLELTAIVLVTTLSHVWAWRFVPRHPATVSYLLAGFPYTLAMILLVTTLLRRRDEIRWPPYKPARNWGHEIAVAMVVGVLTFGATHVTQVLVGALAPQDDAVGYWQLAFRDPIFCAVWPLDTFFMVLYEELVFRAYLPTRLARTFGTSAAASVILSNILFAVGHGYSLAGTAAIFMFGLVLGAVYTQNRSLPGVVLAHWAYNILLLQPYL